MFVGDVAIDVVIVIGVVDRDVVVVDSEGVVKVDIEVDEDEDVAVGELAKTRGDSRIVNRTREDTRITITTALTVTLRVLFIVFIITRSLSQRCCILIAESVR